MPREIIDAPGGRVDLPRVLAASFGSPISRGASSQGRGLLTSHWCQQCAGPWASVSVSSGVCILESLKSHGILKKRGSAGSFRRGRLSAMSMPQCVGATGRRGAEALDAQQAEWSVGKLPMGVYPLRPRTRTWKVNKYTGIEARRTGFWMLPDFGSTAHMIQGATLEAAFADLLAAYSKGSMISQIAAYICLSRVKRLESMCVMQPFSPFLFSHGSPAGPERLIRKLSKQISRDEALMEWETECSEEHAEPSNEGRKDPMVAKHMCTSCYLKKKSE